MNAKHFFFIEKEDFAGGGVDMKKGASFTVKRFRCIAIIFDSNPGHNGSCGKSFE
jgi:hypothetical protein